MAGIRDLVASVLAAAKTAASIIPGTTDDAIVAAGEQLLKVVDTLTGKDDRSQEEMQQTRAELAEAVSRKAERTADRFD